MRVLTIDASSGGFRLAVVDGAAVDGAAVDGVVLAAHRDDTPTGLPERLAPAAAGLLRRAGGVGAIVAVVGPGSFTGIRAGLALAQGLALGFGFEPIAVTVGEAIAASLVADDALPEGRALWVASHARRGRVFLERPAPCACQADALPEVGRVAVAGNAANAVAAALAARGTDVMLLGLAHPSATAVAAVALDRLRGEREPLPFEPLYIDAAEAKPVPKPVRARPAPV